MTRVDFSQPIHPLVEDLSDPFVPVPVESAELSDLDDQVLVDSIHDGHIIPSSLGTLSDAAWKDLEFAYTDERDWGAHYVADAVTRHLGLRDYKKVRLMRPLLDFNRFAGINELSLGHDHRDAIFPPMSVHLNRRQCRTLMEEGYDRIDDALESWIEGKKIKLAIHTYRPANDIGTQRPAVSLITQSASYERQTDLRRASFYEFYPRQLVEFTADRMLTYRMASYLEQSFVPTGLNTPYLLPDGSVEMRAQVWLFIRFLREHYEEKGTVAHRGTREYEAVWNMLLGTNGRSAEATSLREQLHQAARVPKSQDLDFQKLQEIYDGIRQYLGVNHGQIVAEYRFSPERTSCIIIEVRRDYFLEMEPGPHGHDRPVSVNMDRVETVCQAIAAATRDYLKNDLPKRREHYVEMHKSS